KDRQGTVNDRGIGSEALQIHQPDHFPLYQEPDNQHQPGKIIPSDPAYSHKNRGADTCKYDPFGKFTQNQSPLPGVSSMFVIPSFQSPNALMARVSYSPGT